MSNYQNYPSVAKANRLSSSRHGAKSSVTKVTKVTKVNKMGKFKSWLRNWIFDEAPTQESLYVTSDASRDYEDESSLRFTVTPARGGVIFTVRNYDKRQDRHFYTAHVLHDDQNVAEGIAQIVSMELLRGNGT